MVVTDQSTNEVVIVVEVTANLGAYVDLLKTNYIIPTLEYFNNGPFDKAEFNFDYGNTQYALVLFHAADCYPEPSSKCIAPTSSPQKLLSWFNNIQFNGGAGEGYSHIAEGLGTVMQAFEDFQSLHDPNAIVQKHCILVCNSPPYPVPCMESANYQNFLVEQLAAMMPEQNINFSIISPRKIPALYKLFEMAGGETNLPNTVNFAVDKRHLVLLKGYQLKQRPISPTPTSGTLSGSISDKLDIKPGAILPANVQQNVKKLPPLEAAQNQLKSATTQSATGVLGLPPQAAAMQGQMKPRIPTPSSSYAPLPVPTTTVPIIVTGHPTMQTFTSASNATMNQQLNQSMANQPMGVKTASIFTPQNDPRAPVPNVCVPGPRWSQQQGVLNTTAGQPISIQAQNMPVLTNKLMQQPPLIGPGQARMTSVQQKNQPLNQTTIAASTNQPVMVATVSGTPLQSQLIASKAPMGASSLAGSIGANNINILHQQPQANQPPQIGMQNLIASQSQPLPIAVSTVTISSPPNLTVQTNPTMSSTNMVSQQMQPMQLQQQQPGGPKQQQLIWQGILEWKAEKTKNDQGVRTNTCRIYCGVNNGEPDVINDKWPQRIFMQLMPRTLLNSIGQLYLSNAKTVQFHFATPDSEVMQSLNKIMSSGFVGCVHLTPRGTPVTMIKVVMMFYNQEKKTYAGIIPKDHNNFVNAIRTVMSSRKVQIQDHSKQKMVSVKAMQMSGGSVAPGNPTVPNTMQLPTGTTGTPQQGIILTQPNNSINVNTPQIAAIPQQSQPPVQPAQGVSQQVQPTAQYLDERQQNLMQIQKLQQTLEAARQKEIQFKAAQDRQQQLTQQQLQHLQQQQQQPQPRVNQMQQVPQNAANNPQLRHLLQQQAQQQVRHPNQQQQHLLIQQQQQQQQQQQLQVNLNQIPTATLNQGQQPAFIDDVNNIMEFLN